MTQPASSIPGVIVKQLGVFSDKRGWLAECYRADELDRELHPAMAYVSMTLPGVTRGPHEHAEQTDYFCFLGTSEFTLYLWDTRAASGARGAHERIICPQGTVTTAVVPPGVVHAYRNTGAGEGLVLNLPNKLYAGEGKKEKVDEIRHENDARSPYRIT